MMAKGGLDEMAKWGYLAILGLAVAAPFMQWEVTVPLIALGFLVGFVNIREKEEVPFLLAAITISGASAFISQLPEVGMTVAPIFKNLAVAAGAMAVVPAAKIIHRVCKGK